MVILQFCQNEVKSSGHDQIGYGRERQRHTVDGSRRVLVLFDHITVGVFVTTTKCYSPRLLHCSVHCADARLYAVHCKKRHWCSFVTAMCGLYSYWYMLD